MKYKILFFIFGLLIVTSCRKDETKALEIGGIMFGSSKQDVFDVAKERGYKIEHIYDPRVYLKDVQAFGILWDSMNVLVEPINGVTEIVLTRKNSETSLKTKVDLYNEIKKLYPKSERTPYLESFTLTYNNKSITTQFDYADLFELIDEKEEYSGQAFYNLSKDEFSLLIDYDHTKN